MNVLALDLSTKPGHALFIDGKLVHYGTLWADKKAEDFGLYPWNYILLSQHVAQRLYKEVIQPALLKSKGDLHVVIEETTGGAGSNYSQKLLEYIHFSVLQLLQGMNVWYTRTGSWRSVAEVRANDEEKEINKKIKEYKAKNKAKVAKLDLDGSGKEKVVGKLGFKHFAMRRIKEEFGIVLSLKHDDTAESILMGFAFMKGVRLCDGVIGNQSKLKKGKSTPSAIPIKTTKVKP